MSDKKESSYQIKDVKEYIDNHGVIRIDIVGGQTEIYPIGLDIEKNGAYTVLLQINDKKLLDVYADSDKIMSNMVPDFVFIEGLFQIRKDSGTTEAVSLFYGQDIVENGIVEKSDGHMNQMSDAKTFETTEGRIVLRIQCESPSQLSVDFFEKGQTSKHPNSGIVIDHKDNYINVFRDMYSNGVWVHHEREKLGYVNYSIGKPYTMGITIVQDEDNNSGKLSISFVVDGNIKILNSVKIPNFEIDKISVRESYNDNPNPGSYEIEKMY